MLTPLTHHPLLFDLNLFNVLRVKAKQNQLNCVQQASLAMENMGAKMKKSNKMIDSDKRRPIMRRRSQTRRRVPQDFVINMAEARREIVHALHLHRASSSSRTTSSSSSPSTSTTTTSISSSTTMLGNCASNHFGSDKATCRVSSLLFSSQFCCYSLTESLPLPEPIWSTTEPSIPAAAAPPPVAAAMEGLEFEWGENQASSYSWWLGFLKVLDSNNNIVENYNSIYPCLERIHVVGNNSKDTCKLGIGEGPFVDANNIGHDHHQQNSSCPDEWLMLPTTNDDHQNEIAYFK